MAQSVTLLAGADDESELELAGSGDVVTAFVISGQQRAPTTFGVRARHGRPRNRGGILNRIQLAVSYAQKSTPAEAAEESAERIAALAEKLPTVKLADFVFGTTTLRLSRAAVESYTIEPRGTRVYGTYTIVGGAINEPEPVES